MDKENNKGLIKNANFKDISEIVFKYKIHYPLTSIQDDCN